MIFDHITLFDDETTRLNLMPLTLTRPVADLRVGLLTIADKWRHLARAVDYKTVDYLSVKFGEADHDTPRLYVAGHLLPSDALIEALSALNPGEALTLDDTVIAFNGTPSRFAEKSYTKSRPISPEKLNSIDHLWGIFGKNGDEIHRDLKIVAANRESAPLSASCTLIGPADRLFIEPTAKVEGAIINTTGGSVYIGPDAEVMEGSCLRGPVAIAEHAVVNMGTKIYGATTIGPYCKVGGEINNVVFWGYSNKAHDGFLGNAVIGQWCNLGAGCVASNLKNDYTLIKLWNYAAQRFLPTGLQFCGLIMGDHSKAGINTMFNTATVIGVGVNFHGSDFPRNFIPSFKEGSTAGMSDVNLNKFFKTAEAVMARRHVDLTDADRHILTTISTTLPR
ncbi:MAG: glucose-1-phosphate thymidylyltransferase [Muribaculaceae bacterium]|nr:glucose-1-phosphate thymidylyltransferase [Muribaculaceae bacterium]